MQHFEPDREGTMRQARALQPRDDRPVLGRGAFLAGRPSHAGLRERPTSPTMLYPIEMALLDRVDYMPGKSTRVYESLVRRRQAGDTRRRIADAARKLLEAK